MENTAARSSERAMLALDALPDEGEDRATMATDLIADLLHYVAAIDGGERAAAVNLSAWAHFNYEQTEWRREREAAAQPTATLEPPAVCEGGKLHDWITDDGFVPVAVVDQSCCVCGIARVEMLTL